VKDPQLSNSKTIISGDGYSIEISRDLGFGIRQDGVTYDSCDRTIAGQRVHMLSDQSLSSGPSQLFFINSKIHSYNFYVHGPSPSAETIDAMLKTVDIVGPDIPKDWVSYENSTWGFALKHPLGWKVEEQKQGNILTELLLSGNGCYVRIDSPEWNHLSTPEFSISSGTTSLFLSVTGDSSCPNSGDIANTIFYSVKLK